MKNFIFALLFSFIAFPVSADEIEFDGAYVKKKNGDHVELVEQINGRGMYWPNFPKGGVKRYTILKRPKISFVVENKSKTIATEDFKGITIQGSGDDFEYFSLHRLIIKTPVEGRDMFLAVEDKDRLKPGATIHYPGEEIDIRIKTISSKMIYVQPRVPLDSGNYVAWTGDKFWFFELK